MVLRLGYHNVTSAKYSLVAVRRNDTSATPMSDLFRGGIP